MSDLSHSISALLPVRNGQEYLPSLIPRILGMLTKSEELIIVNDGSTDSSPAIIEEFAKIDSRIKLINTTGSGLVNALNLGIKASTNGWIARFDVDDTYSELRLDRQRELIDNNIALIFADYKFVSKKGRSLGHVYSAIYPLPSALALISSQRSAHPVVLINKQILMRCGGYVESDFPVEDLALWMRISTLGTIVSVPEALLCYQLSISSISANNRKIQKFKKAEVVRNFDLWGDWQSLCQDNFKETITLYQTSPNSIQRIFLHLRDLLIAQKLTGIQVPLIQLLREAGPLITIKLAFSGIQISAMAINRKIHRIIGKFV